MSHLLLYTPENRELLESELGLLAPTLKHTLLAPGILEISSQELPKRVQLAYARQLMRDVRMLKANSVKEWIGLLKEAAPAEPFTLHIIELGRKAPFVVSKRCELISAGIRHEKSQSEQQILVQLLILESTGYLSIDSFISENSLPARSPAGMLTIKDDRKAPSRAFKKLLEAELRFGVSIISGERVVDLGGAPGGWSYIALSRGAKVTAIDRSELSAELMRNRALTFIKGDAFNFTPNERVDWLLCDVIAFPEKSIELFKRWIQRNLCKKMIVTIKFKGAPPLQLIHDLKVYLQNTNLSFDIKQLDYNKNEVTVFAAM